MAACSSIAFAMPTQQELKKVQPMVAELMAPTMDDFKAKKKTAADVADMAVKYAAEAETEAAKFMLYRSSIPYYVRGEAYDKAADAVTLLNTNVKDVPAEVIAEIISKATVRANKEKAPRLFELYQQARTQATAEKDVKELRKKPASPANRRKLAEALAMAGKWPEALKEFAKLKDGAAQIAKKELDGGAKSAELGEFWWSYKPTYENADDTFEMHAAVHYRKALAAGEITGLKKNIVEQRIAKYGAVEALAGGQGTGSRAPAATGLYCVIDLSGGPDAKKYPVSYLNDMPKGGWSDEYKTTKLVLRRIEPGAFMMGKSDKNKRVVIGKSFYLGVFEVTQKQWELVMGNRPSFWMGQQWSLRPVEQVTYDRIRGENLGRKWPESDEVDEHSFMWLLRQKTGLRFDLPTEAQWEYACRAGTVTPFHNNCEMVDGGKDPSLDKIARYRGTGGWNEAKWGKFDWGTARTAPDRNCGTNNGTAAVGSYLPNNWGLYDMLGNVYECCLDYYENSARDDVRVIRGGHWLEDAWATTAHRRAGRGLKFVDFGTGFRLCLPLAGGASAQAPVATTPSTHSIELKTGGDSPFTVNGNEATLKLKNGAKLEFVKCPSGWVKVVDDYENKTVRKVEITRPFWIMKQGLRNDDVIGRTLEKYGTGHGFIEPNQEERDKFCSDLTDELRGVLPKGYVVRPPSLVEWEYAYHAGDEDPGSEPFGSLLKFHDWSTFDTHKGTSPVNKWGLHDFHVAEQVFDRIDPSLAAVKVNKKDKKNISKLPDAQSDKDLFFWSDDHDSASYLLRWPTGCALELKPKNSRTGFVRLVIGPDLVSEWKAKNGKK